MPTATATAQYYRFKLLAGRHAQEGRAKHRDNKGNIVPEVPSKIYRQGDEFISPTDLRVLNQQGMPPKFQFLGTATEEEWESQSKGEVFTPASAAQYSNYLEDGLDDLTMSQLLELAKTSDKPVDLTGLTRKADVVRALRAAGVTAE